MLHRIGPAAAALHFIAFGAFAAPGPALKLSVYMTAHQAIAAVDGEGLTPETLDTLGRLPFSAVYVEVYRGGLVVDEDVLRRARAGIEAAGFAAIGGIATVPGEDFGVRQDAQLHWFNWQHPKTQADLAEVMRMSARVFDRFIVDDFLCTADRSALSEAARGERDWGAYRRDLLVDISRDVLIAPAREVNPDIHLIVKFPQWYDLFHRFGYDVARQSDLYDTVFVGTETRGMDTQRFGYVQPYEGYVNYRWIQSIAGEKVRGAWFDHGDCDAACLLDQAYQTVLTGTPEIVLFNFGDVASEHPGHALLREAWPKLEALSAAVALEGAAGVHAVKHPNAPAGGDLYLMDYLGMLGMPLTPVSRYPEDAASVVLLTQSAETPGVGRALREGLAAGQSVTVTAGFLAASGDDSLAELAGVAPPIVDAPLRGAQAVDGERLVPVLHGLDLAADLQATDAEVVLTAAFEERRVPFLTRRRHGEGWIHVLNAHTFTQADFDAINEVLLAPRPLGLLEIPERWANALRAAFNTGIGVGFEVPAKVALQPVHENAWFVQNYNAFPVRARLGFTDTGLLGASDGFSGRPLTVEDESVLLALPARGRVWVEVLGTPRRALAGGGGGG